MYNTYMTQYTIQIIEYILPEDLTSWSENYDIYLAKGANGVSSATTFNGGTWTSK